MIDDIIFSDPVIYGHFSYEKDLANTLSIASRYKMQFHEILEEQGKYSTARRVFAEIASFGAAMLVILVVNFMFNALIKIIMPSESAGGNLLLQFFYGLLILIAWLFIMIVTYRKVRLFVFHVLGIGYEYRISKVARDLSKGVILSKSLKKRMGGFVSKAFINSIEMAEKENSLDKTLDMLASNYNFSQRIRTIYSFGFVYPLLQLAFISLALSGLMIFIVPKFAKIFAELLEGERLPPLTQFVIGIYSVAPKILCPALLLLIFIVVLGNIKVIKRFYEVILMHIPFIGKQIRKRSLCELSNSILIYLASGRNITDAVKSCGTVTGYRTTNACVNKFMESVNNGKEWMEAFDECFRPAPMYSWILRNANEREDLICGFTQVAEMLEDDIERKTKISVRLIEAAGIIINSFIVFLFTASIFLCLIAIIRNLSW